MSRVCVFLACSVDGFIAGPNDEIDWLTEPEGAPDTFTPFLATVGALLMGRRTFDVASGFDVPWPYGEIPVLVATNRPLDSQLPSVRSVHGAIEALVEDAKATAGQANVYIDGGQLIRTALDAGLVDEPTITMMPTILGHGIPLFAGCERRRSLELLSQRPLGGGLLELKYRVLR
jgi:dihydrofolate reductase